MSDLTNLTLSLTPDFITDEGSTLRYGGFGDISQGIQTDQDIVESATAVPGVIDVGDTITINGVDYLINDIEVYSASVTFDNGASTASGTQFAIFELDDGRSVGMFLDGSGAAYGNASQIVLDRLVGGGPVTEADASQVGAGLGAGGGGGGGGSPDDIVDGTETGETIDNSFIDADGDQVDNTGNVIEANGGNDTVFAGTGDDTISGGDGQDWIFGSDGNDLMSGNGDNDSLWGQMGEDTLYGNDGDDKLIGGEGDDLLIGGEGNDTLYGDDVFGDVNGDREPGDAPEPGYGNDTLVLDGGDDAAYGGSGDDTFRVFDGFGNHVIVGGETGEVNGDQIDATAMTEDTTVIYHGDEKGTMSTGTSGVTQFEEIENIYLGSGNDTVEILSSTMPSASTGYVNGGAGFDTLELPEPVPGEPAPVVTVTSETPYPGVPGATTKSGYVDFPDGSRLVFENFEEIICFVPGTRIDTLRGKVAVESLVPGDRVLTRDNGYQPLIWTGRRDLSAGEIAACPAAAPIRIAAGALGKGLPEADLLVSPRHRMLITGARAELMFGEREVLVAAADLLGLPGVSQDAPGAVSYVHVMCEAHQIIRAEGSWSESFQPAAGVLGALDAATRAELLGLFPALASGEGYAAARAVLSSAEARALLAA